MKIFVNNLYEICDINQTDRTDLTEYEVDDEFFKDKCIDFIRGYRYEPQYRITIDEEGKSSYVLDENGEKILDGFSLYPWMDYNQLCQIQLEYELNGVKEIIEPTIDTENCTLDELKDFTVNKFGEQCSQNIYNGVDVETIQGLKHFSYSDDDQRNLKAAADLAVQTNLQIPYHADKEDCCLWDAIDIINIYGYNEMNKTKETTYCNLMNGIIRSAEDKESILKMNYGDELPEEKQKIVDEAVNQAQTVFQALLMGTKAYTELK